MNQDWTTERDAEFDEIWPLNRETGYTGWHIVNEKRDKVLNYIHHREALLIERVEEKHKKEIETALLEAVENKRTNAWYQNGAVKALQDLLASKGV